MAAILFFKMAANPTNSLYRPISTQNVRRTTCLGLYPGFLGRRIDWNNYLSEIDQLYMKDDIHVFQNGCHSNHFSPYLTL